MAQKRAAGKPEERRRGGARQNPEGQLKKRMETRNTPGPRAQWKPGNMIYPVPAVLVTVADCEGNSNIITIAWTGTICTNPPMAYISVRPERYSYHMLRESGEFVINLATESMAYATDYCGVRSGRNVDKWKETGLTPVPAQTVKAPVIAESPVAIECRVTEVKELGSHHMFLAEVTGVSVDEQWLNERGSLELAKAEPIVYSHGGYYGLSELLGTFGWSVKKKKEVPKMKNNVTLIGMPSAGKSTVGVLLAKRLGYSFIDVDLLIQEQEGKRLREIIEEQGLDGFLDVENRVNAGVEAEQAVIAPGGSVIYGKEAMEHLKSIGLVVYLKITYDELVKRVGDVKDRGVALKDGMTLLDLYHERISYFEKYADITIDEEGKELGAVVDELREILEERGYVLGSAPEEE